VSERHRPLPGVSELPGLLLGRLTWRGRTVLALGLASLAAAVVLVQMDSADRDRRDASARAAAGVRARARLAADQRPVRDRLSGSARRRAQAGSSRERLALLEQGLELAVARDVAGRVSQGRLDEHSSSTACTLQRRRRPPSGGAPGDDLLYTCLARTGTPRTFEAVGKRLEIGYRFKARGSLSALSFASVKENPFPLHPTIDYQHVALSSACG